MTVRERYKLSIFASHVDEPFVIQVDSSHRRTMRLVEAESRARGDEQLEDTGDFSIVFYDPDASADCHLPQAAYQIEHDREGVMELFIVPIGPDSEGRGMRYEAVFTEV